MELFLSKHCKSITGSLSKSHGYAIRRRGQRFFSQRTSKGSVPPDGHWRFILSCVELAQNGLLIADICVRGDELISAAKEAGYEVDSVVPDLLYNAQDVISIKTSHGL